MASSLLTWIAQMTSPIPCLPIICDVGLDHQGRITARDNIELPVSCIYRAYSTLPCWSVASIMVVTFEWMLQVQKSTLSSPPSSHLAEENNYCMWTQVMAWSVSLSPQARSNYAKSTLLGSLSPALRSHLHRLREQLLRHNLMKPPLKH